MITINLKRVWFLTFPTTTNNATYEGEVDGKSIGYLHCNPITKELYPESKKQLEELGYTDDIRLNFT